MPKQFYLFVHVVIFIISCNLAISQQYVEAEFGTILSYGVGQSSGIDFNSTLQYDGFNSIYTYQKRSLQSDQSTISKTISDDKGSNVVQMRLDDIGEWTMVGHETNDIICRSVIGATGYILRSDNDAPVWEVQEAYKTIGDYKCQEAKTSYKGRNYTAWFTTEIPVSLGPWLLHGLPGMIIEAYDDNKEVHFYMKSISFPQNFNERQIDLAGIVVSNQKFWSLYLEHEESKKNNGRLLAEQFGAIYYETPIIPARIEIYPID